MLSSAPPQGQNTTLARTSRDTIKEPFLHFLISSPQHQGSKMLALVVCVGGKLRYFLSHIYSVFFFVFFLILPSSSSDFNAVGDVNTALNRHRWADDDDDKGRSDWRIRGRSETNAQGEGVEREWRDNKGGESWMKKGG